MPLKINTNAAITALLVGGFTLAHVGNASALPIVMQLTDEQTSKGVTSSGAGTSFNSLPAVGTYSNAFSGPQAAIPGAPSPGFGFYDDYMFTVAASTADSVSSTIDLGTLAVTGLQERLYKVTGNTPLPVLGDSAGPWSATVPFTVPGVATGETTVLTPEMLTSGTYVLEIRGTATGANGGGYTGQLDLQPVPLPAALPLLLCGLGLLGGAVRRCAAFQST
jgi:hypothetical protein